MNKHLTKSADNRLVCGVIAGICEYFGLSRDAVTFIRIAVAVVMFGSMGSFVVAYLIAVFVLPDAPRRQQRQTREQPHSERKIKEAEVVDDDWSDF